MKVANIFGTPASLAQLTERFGELCADAAQHTDAKIVYELMPPDVNVQTVDAMLEVVGAPRPERRDRDRHLAHVEARDRTGRVRRIPVEYLSWVELSDGQVEYMDDPVDEVVNHRALPGEGEFDIRGYVEACRDHGYGGPWGVEVLSAELRANPMDVIFRRA